MSRAELAPEMRRFILTSIPSVPFLEAVLLLRSERGRSWRAADVARRLYLPEERAGEILADVARAGLAEATAEGAFRYLPVSEQLAALMDALAAQYALDVVAVSELIHSRGDRLAQHFADAFRWNKDS